ncbi:hypothetical protein [Usitatibacter rugosus]|uniref:hypothetical protein n=1 Tax=Usitatibacter rugosus TaxID=2732067 RepID=UPI001489224B|nr:hypothetical protein [Usitatibacter rugosus]
MKIVLATGIAALTFVATALTACIDRPVLSQEQMKAHRTGYPFTFIEQNLSRYDPGSFPVNFSFVSPRDSSFKLEFEPFLASWAALFAGAAVVAWGISRIRRRHAT